MSLLPIGGCPCWRCDLVRSLDEKRKRWTAGSAVAMYERLDQHKPWSSRRSVLRLLRRLTRSR